MALPQLSCCVRMTGETEVYQLALQLIDQVFYSPSCTSRHESRSRACQSLESMRHVSGFLPSLLHMPQCLYHLVDFLLCVVEACRDTQGRCGGDVTDVD